MTGVNTWFADRRIWLKKLLGSVSDFEDTFYGLAEFKSSVDHELLQYFNMDLSDFVCFEVRIVELRHFVQFFNIFVCIFFSKN